MSEHPRVGLGVAIRRDGKILLHKRKGKHAGGVWAFPGGHLEMWESFRDCAIREVAEETGPEIKTTEPKFWTAVNSCYTDEGLHYVVVLMVCDWISGEAQIMEPDKCECWEWFGWDELPDPLILALNEVKQSDNNPWEI